MRRISFAAMFACSLFGATARAACTCDDTIALSTPAYSGSAVDAGQTICVTAGFRNALVISNIHGSSAKPVTIKNCGGLVDIATDAGAALQITGTYFRMTGTGDPSVDAGIRVRGYFPGSNAIQVVDRSSDFEIDHLEVARAGYAGIMAKLDPRSNCDPTVTRPLPPGTFTMRNVHLHDLNIHDVDGEGLYIGDSFYTGTTVYNNGTSACPSAMLQYPHELRGVHIHDNFFRNTGREAIQVGAGVEDVDVHHNRVELYGQVGPQGSQDNGIQFGVGTAGRLHHNMVFGGDAGQGDGLVIQGIGNDYVYDNIVINAGRKSININVRPTPLSTDIASMGFLGGVYIVNNTFIDTLGHGVINEYVNAAPGNVLENNFIVSTTSNWNQLYTTTDWMTAHNTAVTSLSAAGFVNAMASDYRLTSASPARGNGISVSSFGVLTDFNGMLLSASPDVGAFQYVGVDAGFDAGVPDAGMTFDAGAVDAGRSDAGTPDAGALDSGILDAGRQDAGVADAGMITADSGVPDSGIDDAGAIDAGTIGSGTADAGVPDAGASDAGDRDAGLPDSGIHDASVADAGTDPVTNVTTGCGCTSAFDGGITGALVALVFTLRRRRTDRHQHRHRSHHLRSHVASRAPHSATPHEPH